MQHWLYNSLYGTHVQKYKPLPQSAPIHRRSFLAWGMHEPCQSGPFSSGSTFPAGS
jgi:hypothetical protein